MRIFDYFLSNYLYLIDSGLKNFTKFENLIIESISEALKNTEVNISDLRTLLVISSTKGNINLLEAEPMSQELRNRISLSTSAQKISDYFGHRNKPVVVSNACISGLSGLLFAKRMIQSGQYDNAIVTGSDLITRFVFSGFDSFKALSNSLVLTNKVSLPEMT
ncbi:MAG: hypothetical protein IPI10_13980 [Bacteroidetes bacterium]|nr:hypothetical protein [Bacteroidota bacterium]